MKTLLTCATVCVVCGAALAQPVVSEPPEFPQLQPGPTVTYSGSECFLVAEGTIYPGDVDWIRVRLPRASSRTVIDVDFPTGASGSALLAMVENGTTGFNIADNNNTRDALCGMNASSTPQGSTRDSVVDVRETSINAVIDIAITGAADTSFVGLHNESFAYELWVYALPYPCVNDLGCDDGVACTLDQCNVETGDCVSTPQDAACDDAFFCNGVEWCDASLGCRTPGLPDCDDGVDCTDDYCDFALDDCVNDPWDEFCDNLIFCDGTEWCDAALGCQAGEPVDCDDGMACTVDLCDEEVWECLHVSDDQACDDGVFCNGMEFCDGGAGCTSGEAPCGDGLCRESDARCVDCLSDAVCDDGVYCNGVEECDAQGQCTVGTVPCTGAMCRETDDACVECLSDAHCDDGRFCNGTESCDAGGLCAAGAAPCDGGFCRESDDRCVDCLSDADCDDASFCNGIERCDADGACAMGANPCGEAMCDEVGDACVDCLADEDCDDDSFCNGMELCGDGKCKDGIAPCESNQMCDEGLDECLDKGFFTLDIRPGTCPAKLVSSARGYLPVAIVGNDVAMIDPSTLRLTRVDGMGTPVKPVTSPTGQAPQLKDVSGPSEACACPDAGSDGDLDLLVNFQLNEVVTALRLKSLGRKATVELMISGVLHDGTPFSATDCVTVQVTGNPNAID